MEGGRKRDTRVCKWETLERVLDATAVSQGERKGVGEQQKIERERENIEG